MDKPKMSTERAVEIMNTGAKLTQDEINEGWFFCGECDGMLRNNNTENQKCCKSDQRVSDVLEGKQ